MSETESVEGSAAPTTTGERFTDPGAEADYQATIALLLNPPPSQQKVQLLVFSLLAFVGATLAQDTTQSFVDLAILIGVLFVHELGHVAGMRLFGYRDVTMFFIPFFGAAASGRKRGVARWKQGVVLLLGPVPGIVAGTVLAYVGGPELRRLAVMLIAVNGINLLPIAQLDGGQLFQIMLFSRHRHLEVIFVGVTAGLAVVVGLLGGLWFVAIIGAFMLLNLGHRRRVLAAARDLRSAALPQDPAALTDEQRRALYRAMWDSLPANWQKQWRGKPRPQANVMEDLLDRATSVAPDANDSVALGAVWLVALFAGFVALSEALPRPVERTHDGKVAVLAEPSWRSLEHHEPRFSIEMPGPPTEMPGDNGMGMILAEVAERVYAIGWQPVDNSSTWIEQRRALLARTGQIVKQTQEGPHGQTLVITDASGSVQLVRLLVVGNVGFTVHAASKTPDPDAERFVGSFMPH